MPGRRNSLCRGLRQSMVIARITRSSVSGAQRARQELLASESREPREADHLQHEHSGSQRWCVERDCSKERWEIQAVGEESSPFVGSGTASRGQCCTAMGWGWAGRRR